MKQLMQLSPVDLEVREAAIAIERFDALNRDQAQEFHSVKDVVEADFGYGSSNPYALWIKTGGLALVFAQKHPLSVHNHVIVVPEFGPYEHFISSRHVDGQAIASPQKRLTGLEQISGDNEARSAFVAMGRHSNLGNISLGTLMHSFENRFYRTGKYATRVN